jgi:hypothetical protein
MAARFMSTRPRFCTLAPSRLRSWQAARAEAALGSKDKAAGGRPASRANLAAPSRSRHAQPRNPAGDRRLDRRGIGQKPAKDAFLGAGRWVIPVAQLNRTLARPRAI